ncbi:MAG: MBL fold metallo-hydrolase [Leptospiraceae bacterium]|nr:MBL fold metallo-hydrolase [Leptospiraceae bacterium]MDW8305733.1 MBL fold metallo-hydrolase [Leptospiraceae bacterium]
MTELFLGHFHLKAIGLGGIESCYILPEFQLAFDFGRCPEELIDISRVFLTHGHLDHASGLPYYFSQRSLKHLDSGEVYVPKQILEPLRQILELWHKIEDFSYTINLIPVEPGDKIEVRQNYYIRPLLAHHRICALGYVLVKETRKLKQEFLNLPGEKIRELKEKGERIFDIQETPLFCFSGDTTIEFVTQNPLVQKTEILLLECTYIDEKKPVEIARKWGHVHLDEIATYASCFQNKQLILTHFSKRYTPSQIEEFVKKKLPEELWAKTILLVRPFEKS